MPVVEHALILSHMIPAVICRCHIVGNAAANIDGLMDGTPSLTLSFGGLVLCASRQNGDEPKAMNSSLHHETEMRPI